MSTKNRRLIKEPVFVLILASLILFPIINNYKIFLNIDVVTAEASHNSAYQISLTGRSYYEYYTMYEFKINGKSYYAQGTPGFSEQKGSKSMVLFNKNHPQNNTLLKASAMYIDKKILLVLLALVVYSIFKSVINYNKKHLKNS